MYQHAVLAPNTSAPSVCVYTQGEMAWLPSCRGREVSSIPPQAVPKMKPCDGVPLNTELLAFLSNLSECFESTLLRTLLRLWMHGWWSPTWLGGMHRRCSITSMTMRYLEEDCQLHEPGLRMPCCAHQVFCFTPKEVKWIPFPTFQPSIEIAAAESKVISACCDVHAVI